MNIDLRDPRVWTAIVIGALATYPVFFLYERVLRVMAWLQDHERSVDPPASLLILIARYAFAICWIIFVAFVFILAPMHYFPARYFDGPVTAYLFS